MSKPFVDEAFGLIETAGAIIAAKCGAENADATSKRIAQAIVEEAKKSSGGDAAINAIDVSHAAVTWSAIHAAMNVVVRGVEGE